MSRCVNFDDFIFWQSDTKLCWGNEKMVGEMQQFVGEMKHFVGETKHFVGEMKQMDGEMKQNVLGKCPEGKVK